VPRIPVTRLLLADLLATARADGVTFAHAAAVIEHHHSILLLHQGDGDDFSPFRWQVPTGLVMGMHDQLPDVIHRAVTHTAGFDLDQVTSYLGHHDEPACDRGTARPPPPSASPPPSPTPPRPAATPGSATSGSAPATPRCASPPTPTRPPATW